MADYGVLPKLLKDLVNDASHVAWQHLKKKREWGSKAAGCMHLECDKPKPRRQ